jgi:hypothetical protein
MSLIQGWVGAGRPGRKERPILFSSSMVQAILDGLKAQTRRVVKPQPKSDLGLLRSVDGTAWTDRGRIVHCPYGQPGERLWVRETWRTAARLDARSPAQMATEALEAGWNRAWAPIKYEADGAEVNADVGWGPWGKTRVPIHMPRWASRLTLEVTEVRVQRLQAISEEDALAEGVAVWMGMEALPEQHPPTMFRDGFQALWQAINGERKGCAWKDSPWVWAVSFKVAR